MPRKLILGEFGIHSAPVQGGGRSWWADFYDGTGATPASTQKEATILGLRRVQAAARRRGDAKQELRAVRMIEKVRKMKNNPGVYDLEDDEAKGLGPSDRNWKPSKSGQLLLRVAGSGRVVRSKPYWDAKSRSTAVEHMQRLSKHLKRGGSRVANRINPVQHLSPIELKQHAAWELGWDHANEGRLAPKRPNDPAYMRGWNTRKAGKHWNVKPVKSNPISHLVWGIEATITTRSKTELRRHPALIALITFLKTIPETQQSVHIVVGYPKWNIRGKFVSKEHAAKFAKLIQAFPGTVQIRYLNLSNR